MIRALGPVVSETNCTRLEPRDAWDESVGTQLQQVGLIPAKGCCESRILGRCNLSFWRDCMAAVGEVKWVLVRGVWLRVRIKHVGKTGLALVDFLNGSGSSLFPVEELFDENGY